MIKSSIRAVNRTAHLCPPRLMGSMSCCVKRLMNQPWRVKRRLFSHRLVGVGMSTHGRLSARAIKGIPRCVGLMNWSKKLRIMVRFRVQV